MQKFNTNTCICNVLAVCLYYNVLQSCPCNTFHASCSNDTALCNTGMYDFGFPGLAYSVQKDSAIYYIGIGVRIALGHQNHLLVNGTQMGRSFDLDRKKPRGSLSQQVWHDKYHPLLKDHASKGLCYIVIMIRFKNFS